MGLLSRLFVPRTVRRAVHPARTVKRAVTPRSVKRVRRAMHPVSNVTYGVTRSLNTKKRLKKHAPTFHHGGCPVNHRSPETAARCHRTH
jgi:hypothetical protein